MNLLDKIQQASSHLGILDFGRIALDGSVILIFLSALFWVYKSGIKYKPIIATLLLFLLVRQLILANPAAWFAYYKTLSWEDIGFRQVDTITYKLRRYFKPENKIEYLAIGSSQTGALFRHQAKQDNSFYKVELAGMNPIEYDFYKEEVERLQPDIVLLQLSIFDLGRKPNYSTIIYAPENFTGAFEQIFHMVEQDDSKEATKAAKDYLIGHFFPEYKYSYIFKGLKNKFITTQNVKSSGRLVFKNKTREEKTADQTDALKKEFSLDYKDLYLSYLRRFLSFCNERGVKVVIAQGQYHPNAYTEKNKRFDAIIQSSLIKLTQSHSNSIYFSRSEIYELSKDEFVDGYHASQPGAKIYTQKLLEKIDLHFKLASK